MTVTYPADPLKPYGERVEMSPTLDAAHEPFVPVYARRGKAARGANSGKIKTWMILAPLGVIVLGGIVAMTMLDKGDAETTPLAEPAATAPVVSATPLIAAPAPATTTASTPAPVQVAPAPAPVLREATPVRRAAAPAPVRGAVTPTAPRPVAAAAARTTTPAPAASSTATLNAAPTPSAPVVITPAPEPTPPAPVIVVEPLN